MMLSLNDKTINYLSDEFINKFRNKVLKIISISRAETMDNECILKCIKSGKISESWIDILGNHKRQELLDTRRVFYTLHTSWCFGNIDKKKNLENLKIIVDNYQKI